MRMREVLAGKKTDRRDTENSITLYTTRVSVSEQFPEAVLVTEGLRRWCRKVFAEADALIFIGASGIAVRTIAPFLVSKASDPAVLAADEWGNHVISLLSGHLGGANALTLYLAEKLGADPVITTASDVNGKLAVDVWAKKNHLLISDMKMARRAASEIVDGKRVPFYCDGRISGDIPEELMVMKPGGEPADSASEFFSGENSELSIVVSVFSGERWREILAENGTEKDFLHLVPSSVVLGVGCKKGKPFAEIWEEISGMMRERRISPESICRVASIDLKAGEEGLKRLAAKLGVPFETFSAETLRRVPGVYESSAFVREITGVDNVCERAAMAALTGEEQKKSRFLLRKTAGNGVTAALLEKDWGVTFEKDICSGDRPRRI